MQKLSERKLSADFYFSPIGLVSASNNGEGASIPVGIAMYELSLLFYVCIWVLAKKMYFFVSIFPSFFCKS